MHAPHTTIVTFLQNASGLERIVYRQGEQVVVLCSSNGRNSHLAADRQQGIRCPKGGGKMVVDWVYHPRMPCPLVRLEALASADK